ncbi:MAG: TonB-dependent receptor [Amphiplicatus sp.]
MKVLGTRLALMFSAAAGALAAASTGAAAQDEGGSFAARADASRDRIVVTARRKEENIQDVPVAVTALDQQALDRLVVNNFNDLNKLSPGLQVGGTISRNSGGGPNIRALPTGTNSGTTSVVSYFAEVPNFRTSFFDLESLQVLKGPQGTLFGETAVGGALLYTPRKPTNEFDARLGVQVGNYDYKQFDAAIGGALVEDRLMVRAAGRWRKRDGFTTGIFADGSPSVDLDDVDSAQWRFSVVWKPTDNIETYTIYAGSHSRNNGSSHIITYADRRLMAASRRNQAPADSPQLAAAYEFYGGGAPPAGMSWADINDAALARQNAAGPRTAFLNYDQAVTSDFHGLINQTRWDILDNLTFKNIFGLYWSTSSGNTAHYDGIDAPLFEGRNVVLPGSATQNANYGEVGGWPGRDWTEEAQLLGTLFDGRVDWQGGCYYRLASSRDFFTSASNLLAARLYRHPAPNSFCTGADIGATSPCSRAGRQVAKTYAVYGQATFAVTDDVHLTGGFRHSWDIVTNYETASRTQFVTFNGFDFPLVTSDYGVIPGAGVSSTVVPLTQHNTYSVAADWKVSDAVLLYVAHRTGYTRGGINSSAPIGDPSRTFGPETIKDIEFGVKADWSLGGATGRTNIALYRDWYKDVQRSDVLPGLGTSGLTNAGDASIKGFEFENVVNLTDWLEVRTNVGYVDAHFVTWLESSTCSRQAYREPCIGLPGSTPFVIDHANGVLTGLGAPINFEPDRFRGAAKWNASIQPTVHLDSWVGGEDISIGANVYYKSSFSSFTTSTHYFAGMTLDPRPGVFGGGFNPFIVQPYTLADLQADWRHVAGSAVSIGARVTNLMNTLYAGSGALGSIATTGSGVGYAGEPRMWYLEFRVDM